MYGKICIITVFPTSLLLKDLSNITVKTPKSSLCCSLSVSLSRNPSLKQQLFSYAILGFALSEAMGLFCLMVAFLILFAM